VLFYFSGHYLTGAIINTAYTLGSVGKLWILCVLLLKFIAFIASEKSGVNTVLITYTPSSAEIAFPCVCVYKHDCT
jgi:hypothetical protein